MTRITAGEVCWIVPGRERGAAFMEWLDRARAILNGTQGLSLPDPDRLDIGSVPDTALLIQAIDAAMPRTAILHLIGPRHKALLPFLARRSIAMRRSAGEYLVSLEDGGVAALPPAAHPTRCARTSLSRTATTSFSRRSTATEGRTWSG